MKSDLNYLMKGNTVDAIIAIGSASDPNFAYLTDGAEVSEAVFTRTREDRGTIWLWFLEREGVKNPDIKVHLFDRALYQRIFTETNNHELAQLEIYLKSLDFLGDNRRRVVIYGRLEFSFGGLLRHELMKRYPYLEIVNDQAPTLVDRLRSTKDSDELARMIDVGRRTSQVMVKTRDFIRSHRTNNDIFIKPEDSPLTVGDVKRFARSRLLEDTLEDTDGMIFAPGKQATVGHNTGEADTPIRLGEPIIFDLFPREIRGYYHDVTRTWCFGHASDEIQHLHEEVLGCFNLVKREATPGISGAHLQELACDYLRDRGHPVVKDDPELTDGYSHSLGHGVGLAVHERPYIGIDNQEILSVGNVFALEPGLSYTKRGLAARIEDTLYLNSDGDCISITDVPYDLIIPIR